MKQAEIKRTLPSRSENNLQDGQEEVREEGAMRTEQGRGGRSSSVRILPFAQLKFPFLSYAVGFVFLLSIRDRGIKGRRRGNNNSPLKKRFHRNESQDLNCSLR